MGETEVLSNVTKVYLQDYQKIFYEMRKGMINAPLSESISGNFIMQMIPHHQAAINMSRNILKYTTCIPLQEIALGIINEQTRSIENMRRMLSSCQMLKNTSQELCDYKRNTDQIMAIMFEEMADACVTNDVSENFMREMIPHHAGAVHMSENTLRYRICRQLNPVLEAIILSQKKGIRQMTQLLRDKSCSCNCGEQIQCLSGNRD